ncbi:hypothetical protein JAAARDRAFT_39738 [Jaapia argillacea MUCL 33604]|uniref:Proline dehydrogenase n=1 Tax=Jaapia argillacea MUCL 33604 TaxID=933084 RepID=A0A067PDP6_9AGAM|nr:hypothetical protein JAAARDRAFT_39738 [Jaapia argillacea MUCL 33604]
MSLRHLLRPLHLQTRVPLSSHRRLARLTLFGGALLGTTLYLSAKSPLYADNDEHDPKQKTPNVSLGSLIRSYAVYSMCSIPALVDASPAILKAFTSVPGLKQVTEAVVRVTFFDQFVGGDTAEDCLPLLASYRAQNKGVLFGYSVEVDESAPTPAPSSTHEEDVPIHKRIVKEMIHSIDVAADFEDRYGKRDGRGRKTWVAVKLTALLPDAQALINFSSHLVKSRPNSYIPFPGCPHPTDLDILYSPSPESNLRPEDIKALKELDQDLVAICQRAQERGVRIIMDAEYSWYQPAIDAYVLSLTRRFNKLDGKEAKGQPVRPLVYQTYQAYLRRTPMYLSHSLKNAKAGNYALGVKLVRGAYHPHEMAAHPSLPSPPTSGSTQSAEMEKSHSLSISPDPLPPVWFSKEQTDDCYNKCAKLVLAEIKSDLSPTQTRSWWPAKSKPTGTEVPRIGVLFGTHNWESCKLILGQMVQGGLATSEGDVVRVGEEVCERVTIAQLYGMSDALTDYLVGRTRSDVPLVMKYVPYGALSEVMPYLSRRAIENKSVLGNGGAADERRRAGAEIWKRVFG